MKNNIEIKLKAEKRDNRKRPRMKVSGSSLKKKSNYSGFAAAKITKKK